MNLVGSLVGNKQVPVAIKCKIFRLKKAGARKKPETRAGRCKFVNRARIPTRNVDAPAAVERDPPRRFAVLCEHAQIGSVRPEFVNLLVPKICDEQIAA